MLSFFLCLLFPIARSELNCDSTAAWSDLNYCTIFNDSKQTPLKFSTSCTVTTCIDPRYGDFRLHSNNLRFTTDASFIAFPRHTKNVVGILRDAVRNGLRPTVRSGGHCFEDYWSNNTGGILIDLSLMNEVYLSGHDGLIWVEPGVLIADLYKRLYKELDLVIPGGVCLEVAVGGHVLGAGYGHLARQFGLISDYVHAFEIVRVKWDGSIHVDIVSQNSSDSMKQDLFWALRGGGSQNFGLVTRIAFTGLPRAIPVVLSVNLNWSLNELGPARFGNLLRKYVAFFVENSRVGNAYCNLSASLNLLLGPNGSHVQLIVLTIGNNTDIMKSFLRKIGASKEKMKCQKMSLYRFLMTSYNMAKPSYYVRNSAYMVGHLPEHQRDTFWQYFSNETLYGNVKNGAVRIRGYGCAVSKLTESATAYPHRKAVIKIEFAASWNPQGAQTTQRWFNDLYKTLYGEFGPMPDGIMDGSYYNYPNRDLINWQYLYFKHNYEKLRRVKRRWDPLNVFWHRQSIEI